MNASNSSISKNRKKSTSNEKIGKRSAEYGSVKAKVQESLNMRSVFKNNGLQPQIMNTSKKNASSTADLQSFNRSGATSNLSQSKKQQHSRTLID